MGRRVHPKSQSSSVVMDAGQRPFTRATGMANAAARRSMAPCAAAAIVADCTDNSLAVEVAQLELAEERMHEALDALDGAPPSLGSGSAARYTRQLKEAYERALAQYEALQHDQPSANDYSD